jgi:hypothetical protein
MVKRRFICDRCQKSFVVEVLEPGEAERKRLRPSPISCPDCHGPVRPE